MTKNDLHNCPIIKDNDPTNIKPLRNKNGLSSIEIKRHILKYRPNWDALYRRFGVKKINMLIDNVEIYAGMDGRPHISGDIFDNEHYIFLENMIYDFHKDKRDRQEALNHLYRLIEKEVLNNG